MKLWVRKNPTGSSISNRGVDVESVTGLEGAGNRAALRDGMDAGADVVGGCPHLDLDPTAAMHFALEVAGELDRPIDLHTD